jgi:peptidyl-prolyl cis-trans isomerase C
MTQGGCFLIKKAALWIITGAIIGLSLSCAQEEPEKGLAKVGDYVITEQTLLDRLEGMPPFMQQQLATQEGRQRFVQALVEEEIIVREALKRGFDDSEEYKDEIKRRERDLLVRLFYEKVIQAEATPPDSEVVAYYEAHIQDYSIPEHARARHILVESRQRALELKSQIESGADFGELAKEFSLDQQTRQRQGVMHGRIEREAPIKGMGDVPELKDAIFSLKVGEVSDPVKTDLGYHLVRVDELNPESARPLAEVEADISSVLTNTRREGVRDRILADLKSEYGVVYLSESPEQAETPEALFKMASEESDPRRKIEHYQKFIDTYPDDDRTYEAKFMIGFTLAEDLQDYDEAEKVFKEFLEEYPENDLSDDANWMLENMRSGGQPDFAPE